MVIAGFALAGIVHPSLNLVFEGTDFRRSHRRMHPRICMPVQSASLIMTVSFVVSQLWNKPIPGSPEFYCQTRGSKCSFRHSGGDNFNESAPETPESGNARSATDLACVRIHPRSHECRSRAIRERQDALAAY